MKVESGEYTPDAIDLAILDLLQDNCKQPLAAIGEKVGLTAPSVMERIHKLEEAGVIVGYTALLDARRLGRDVTAFIGVSTGHPRAIRAFEVEIAQMREVLDCHHITGEHTLMVKVKTHNTAALEQLIDRMRAIEGVTRTETMVVLSTHTEQPRIGLDVEGAASPRRPRRGAGGRPRRSSEPARSRSDGDDRPR